MMIPSFLQNNFWAFYEHDLATVATIVILRETLARKVFLSFFFPLLNSLLFKVALAWFLIFKVTRGSLILLPMLANQERDIINILSQIVIDRVT